jgi:hypothetical protein
MSPLHCLYHCTEEIKECNMYRLGFCIYGPQCRFKHRPLPGEGLVRHGSMHLLLPNRSCVVLTPASHATQRFLVPSPPLAHTRTHYRPATRH